MSPSTEERSARELKARGERGAGREGALAWPWRAAEGERIPSHAASWPRKSLIATSAAVVASGPRRGRPLGRLRGRHGGLRDPVDSGKQTRKSKGEKKLFFERRVERTSPAGRPTSKLHSHLPSLFPSLLFPLSLFTFVISFFFSPYPSTDSVQAPLPPFLPNSHRGSEREK